MFNAVVNPPKRNTCWCGPAAISIITGCGYDDAIARLKLDLGKPVVKGVPQSSMRRVLNAMGYSVAPRTVENEPTLAGWLSTRQESDLDKTFLVTVTGHYIVVKGRKACDNKTKAPVWLKDMHSRRARVQEVWEIISRVQPGEDEFSKEATAMRLGWRVEPLVQKLTVYPVDRSPRKPSCTMTFQGQGYWAAATAHLRAIRKAGLCLA